MKKVVALGVFGVMGLGAAAGVREASAAITIPPAANVAYSDTHCYGTDTAGRVRHILNPSSSCQPNVYTNVYVGASFQENPGSSVAAFWNTSAPSGTEVCGQLRTYSSTGALWASSSLICGAGDKNTVVSKTNGGALLRVRFLTTNSSVARLNHVVFN